MVFHLIKSTDDGLSVSTNQSLEEVLNQIVYFRGWDSLEDLKASIRLWANKANPGDTFSTGVASIVAAIDRSTGVGENECPECLSTNLYLCSPELKQIGYLEHEIICLDCDCRWIDKYISVAREKLA